MYRIVVYTEVQESPIIDTIVDEGLERYSPDIPLPIKLNAWFGILSQCIAVWLVTGLLCSNSFGAH